MKLIDILNEVYPYRKGPSMVKPKIKRTTMDIDHLYKQSRSFEEFEAKFKKKFPQFPVTPETKQELASLWSLYHGEVNA